MIPVEALARSDTAATFRLQDIDQARALRDRLRSEGKNAFMVRSGATVFVLVSRQRKAA
jgi:hypothetical protein